jgi:hypothetical protein
MWQRSMAETEWDSFTFNVLLTYTGNNLEEKLLVINHG